MLSSMMANQISKRALYIIHIIYAPLFFRLLESFSVYYSQGRWARVQKARDESNGATGEQYINKYQKEKKKDTHIYIQLVLLYT
jgi:hypothetical protein